MKHKKLSSARSTKQRVSPQHMQLPVGQAGQQRPRPPSSLLTIRQSLGFRRNTMTTLGLLNDVTAGHGSYVCGRCSAAVRTTHRNDVASAPYSTQLELLVSKLHCFLTGSEDVFVPACGLCPNVPMLHVHGHEWLWSSALSCHGRTQF